MTSVDRSQPGAIVGASVRSRAGAARRRRFRPLESLGRALVRRVVERVQHGRIRVVDVASGESFESTADPGALGVATIRVHDPRFYGAAAFGGSVGVAESYIEGAWETDSLAALIELITVNLTAADALEGPLARFAGVFSRAAYWLERNSRAGSRRNIVAHYDLGNDFFATFLDPTMTYSSGVFENGAVTLEESQIEKMDRACRKLDLCPDDHLLEIGTGWGSMAIHAARNYGCRVTTTTISDEQHRLATKRVADAGLSDRVTVLKRDYRDLEGKFDKLVSIEMIEAVGAENLEHYFEVCSRCLKPDGGALIQAIVIRDQYFERAARRRDFLKKYIFPGSCLPSNAAMLRAMCRRTDLRVWHTEDLASHYATTLHHWSVAFEERLEEVRAMGFDERFIRMWRYYFGYCEGAFRARHVGVVQMLLTKPMCRIEPAGEASVGVA